MYVLQRAHPSAQVAADSGRVRHGKVIPSHGQFAADSAAHVGVTGVQSHAASHLALEADVTGADNHTFPHMTAIIHPHGLHQPVEAVAQLAVEVERIGKVVDVAFYRSAHHGSFGKTHKVALDGAAHFHRPAKSQQVAIDNAIHAHNVA